MSISGDVLDRDEGRCFRCGAAVRADAWPGYNCHHRQLQGAGGADTPENRITLCGSGTTACHGWVHGHVAESYAHGWLVSRYGDPERIWALHHALGEVFLTPDLQRVPADPAAIRKQREELA